jgi:hypothetical protein
MLLCNNSVTSIDNTQLSLYMGYKKKMSYSHSSYIQLYSIVNRINTSRFSVPWVRFVGVLMFVQQYAYFSKYLILAESANLTNQLSW